MSTESRDFVEIASVANGTILIALKNGNFIVSNRSPIASRGPFLTALRGSSAASTRALLAAAMYAPMNEVYTTGVCENRFLTLSRVILSLIGNYHTTHATPPTLRVATERFRAMGRTELAEFLEEKIREETGHDLLALKDLHSLGLPAERMVEIVRPQLAVELVNFFEAAAHAEDPIAVVGYSYALERNALFIGQEYIDMVEAVCPAGVVATRCLRVHSGVGADASHVAEMVEFIATLPDDDRLAVIQAVYNTTKIIATTQWEDEMSDEEIDRLLDEAKCAADPKSSRVLA